MKIALNQLDQWIDAAPNRQTAKGQTKGAKRPSAEQQALAAYRRQQRDPATV